MPQLQDQDKPKPGQASPLEGFLGKEIVRVLNLAFLGIGLSLSRDLAMKAGPALQAPLDNSMPLSTQDPFKSIPGLTAPKPPSWSGGSN